MECLVSHHVLCDRLQMHTEAVKQNLNLSALIPYLHEKGLIDDLQSGIADDSRPSQDRKGELVSLVIENSAVACTKFLQALYMEDSHLGHRYIWSLLMDHKYADEKDISTSTLIQKRLYTNMRRVVKGMKLDRALIAHLHEKKLLTANEFEMLTQGNKSANNKNQTVLRWLHSKGPTAHLLFAQCLKEETTHCTHGELFQLISGEGTAESNTAQQEHSMSRKRKLKDREIVSVEKRVPSRLAIEGELRTVEYLEAMKTIRQYHNQGKWKAVEEMVRQSANKSTEFHVAVLLESCTGLIIQTQRDKVLQVVAEARELCFKIDNNCETYLLGRCDYTMARMHQYANERDEALKCIRTARSHQYNVELGEDTALTNYCYGCILLECLANGFDSETDKITQEAEMSLESAIMTSDQSENYGLDVAHPKIRLAQLYLGSSSSCPGTKTDSKSLEKALYYIKIVDENLESLAPQDPMYLLLHPVRSI